MTGVWIPIAIELIALAKRLLGDAERAGVAPDEWEAARLSADAAEIAKFGRSSREVAP